MKRVVIPLAAALLWARDVPHGLEARRGPTPAVVAAARVRAEGAATALTADVFSAMARVVAQHPADEALMVCRDIATQLTERVARREGVTVRRTALRVRDPANAPDAYERAVLQRWAATEARIAPHVGVVRNAAGDYELRYLRPIVLQPTCITCHGPSGGLTEAVRRALRARYPDDLATGFAVGDVRGAVSVRVPLAVPLAPRDGSTRREDGW